MFTLIKKISFFFIFFIFQAVAFAKMYNPELPFEMESACSRGCDNCVIDACDTKYLEFAPYKENIYKKLCLTPKQKVQIRTYDEYFRIRTKDLREAIDIERKQLSILIKNDCCKHSEIKDSEKRLKSYQKDLKQEYSYIEDDILKILNCKQKKIFKKIKKDWNYRFNKYFKHNCSS